MLTKKVHSEFDIFTEQSTTDGELFLGIEKKKLWHQQKIN